MSSSAATGKAGLRAVPAALGISRLARLLPGLAVLVPLTMLVGAAWLTWREVRGDAADAMRRSAEAVSEYAARALEGYAVTAGRLNDRLIDLSDDDIRTDERRLHLELRRILRDIPHGGEAALVLNRAGHVLVSSEHFPAQRAAPGDGRYLTVFGGTEPPSVHIGEPRVSAGTGEVVFQVARRRDGTGNQPRAPDGFEGVVLIAIRSSHVSEGLRRLALTPTDTIALVQDYGAVLASSSGQPAVMASAPADGPYSAAVFGRGPMVFERQAGTWTTRIGLGAIQPVGNFRLHALALRPRAQLWAAWRASMAGPVAFALPATLILLLLSLKVRRDQFRLAVLNLGLRGDVARGMDRLRRAEEIGMIGTFEFHLPSGNNVRSAEYMSVHGLPAVEARETHADWLRRLHPEDRDRAEAHLLATLADPLRENYSQTYRIVTPGGEVRWIMSRGHIERDTAGKPLFLRGAHLDITHMRSTEMALADADARLRLAQEAVGIGTWEWVPATRTLTCSRKMLELWSLDPAAPAPGLEQMLAAVHAEDREALASLMAHDREGVTLRREIRLPPPATHGQGGTVWIALRATFKEGDQLAPGRMLGVAYDISDRKHSEELTTIMAHEVEHRAKNALMVVSSLLRMTKADSAEKLVEVMDGRVRALSRTLGLLGQGHWRGAPLRDIVHNEVGHFERPEPDTPPAITMEGPTVTIDVDAAQPLSMALHELATNAAKYGALSTATGSLRIVWWEDGATLRLRWTERGGPPLAGTPPERGFGSHLIKTLVESQLQGSVEMQWQVAGLVCDIAITMGKPG